MYSGYIASNKYRVGGWLPLKGRAEIQWNAFTYTNRSQPNTKSNSNQKLANDKKARTTLALNLGAEQEKMFAEKEIPCICWSPPPADLAGWA